MKKFSFILSSSVFLATLMLTQVTVVTADQETKPNLPIPSEVAKNLLITEEQDDDTVVENPPISSDTAKDLLVPSTTRDNETVENPPISAEVANSLIQPVKILPKTSAVPSGL